jgi:hypothetical protein
LASKQFAELRVHHKTLWRELSSFRSSCPAVGSAAKST